MAAELRSVVFDVLHVFVGHHLVFRFGGIDRCAHQYCRRDNDTEQSSEANGGHSVSALRIARARGGERLDRKSTRLNSSHANISYAVFCLKKKTRKDRNYRVT